MQDPAEATQIQAGTTRAFAPAAARTPKAQRKSAQSWSWRPGFPNRKVPASRVGQEFVKVRAQFKEVNKFTLLDYARNTPSSPLNQFFDWNDTTAAEKHRLSQAQNLLGACVQIIPGNPIHTRAMVQVHFMKGGKQVTDNIPTGNALSNKALRDQIVRAQVKEVIDWAARVESYATKPGLRKAVVALVQRFFGKAYTKVKP